MSYISPRSLKLLEDIVNESDNRATAGNDDLVECSHQSTDLGRRVENMTEAQTGNFDDTLNLFEKLERENGPVSNGHVQNGHVENGVKEEGEESEEESYTVNEFSETTADTTFDNDTSSSSLPQRRRGRGTKVTNKKDFNQNYLSTKTSSLREGSTDRDSASDRIETMSDSGRVGRQQRKLNKRAQMREFRTIGLEPLETAEERLEQKYMELQQLMSGQFMEQKVALTHNHIQQMELLRQQYAIASHGLPPTGVLVPRSMPAQFRNRSYNRRKGDKENLQHPASEDEAYNTIRTLQTTNAGQRRSRARTARTRPLSATRMNHSRSTSRERHEKTPDKRPTTAIEEGQQRSRQRKKSRSRSNSRSRSSSGSPRPGTDTFLKNSENEFVRDWVKRKDLEFRRKKAEEKKRKRLERKEKIEKQIEKEERYKESKLIVQQWMRQKKRESFRRKKDEKAALNDEASRRAYERAKTVSGIHGFGVNRPMSAPAPIRTERSKLRVQRPGTTVEEIQEKQEQMVREAVIGYIETEASAELPLDEEPPPPLPASPSNEPVQPEFPQPPVTKYVYRRPVLGKVRLRMGKYQQAPEETKPPPSPGKKPVAKPLSKEEVERNQRISYDEWLQVKRKENDEKKKEMQRQNELAQSEPKYERPIPELVQNAEGNVLQGRAITQRHPRGRVLSQEEQEDIREQARRKKQVRSFEEEINVTFDTRSESPEEALDRVAKDIVKYVLKSLSSDEDEGEDQEGYFEDEDEAEHEGLSSLHVVGSKAPMSCRGRPMSASAAGIPCPQSSKSPRRPASAQPKPGWTGDPSQRGPYPPDNHHQYNRMFFNSNGDERPEPQGSDASDPRGFFDRKPHFFTSEYDDERSDALDPDSMTSSKKRVSFCEETTVFDETEVDEDPDDWGDMDEDSADLQKARNLFNLTAENPGSEGGVVITKTDEVDV